MKKVTRSMPNLLRKKKTVKDKIMPLVKGIKRNIKIPSLESIKSKVPRWKRTSSTRNVYAHLAKQELLNDYYGYNDDDGQAYDDLYDDLYEDGYYGEYDDQQSVYLKGYMAGFKAAQQRADKILRRKYRN